MINYSVRCFWSFFHFLFSNVPDNKCHKQNWRVLLFIRMKLVARIKWRRLPLKTKKEASGMKWVHLTLAGKSFNQCWISSVCFFIWLENHVLLPINFFDRFYGMYFWYHINDYPTCACVTPSRILLY